VANDEPQQQQPDTSEPSDEPKVEFEMAYERQKTMTPNTPYKDVRIRTLGELQWIMQQRNWSVDLFVPEGMERANLSGVNLRNVNLSGVSLESAFLSGARLRYVNLAGANLTGVNFSGANLYGANLSHAKLSRVIFDNEADIDDVVLDAYSKVLDVRWNGVPLSGIPWNRMSRFGDEPPVDSLAKIDRQQRIRRYHRAARSYHGIAVALRDQGLAGAASAYRLRELVMERKALRYERNVGGWLLNCILGAVAGHGEKPGRIFIAYLVVVLSFATAYLGVTHFVETGLSHLSWDEALVLSLTSFHGRGFFPGFLSLGDWVSRIAALEAVIGLFIELILIATFSRRFLGD